MDNKTESVGDTEISFSRPRAESEQNFVEVIEGYFNAAGIDLFPNWRNEVDIAPIFDANPYLQQYILARNLNSKLVIIATKIGMDTEAARFAVNTKVRPNEFLENVLQFVIPTFLKAMGKS